MADRIPLLSSRRRFCVGAAALFLGTDGHAQPAPALSPPAASAAPPAPADRAPQTGPVAAPAAFSFDDVVASARQLAANPYQAPSPRGQALSPDVYRDVRFRAERAFLGAPGSKFRLELFPIGIAGASDATIHTVVNGVSRKIDFSPDFFDFGPLVDDAARASVTGFAGLRLRFPLSHPDHWDESIAFLRGSYFRIVGRDERYGQSACALAIGEGGASQPEVIPFFREFWVFAPARDAEAIELCALLDSPALSGAYRMIIRPGRETTVDVTARLFARTAVERLGYAPMSSMYLTGESGPRVLDDFRLEVHDTDGLSALSRSGEWIWRPLRNPIAQARAEFPGQFSGFGLSQRRRDLAAYQDIEAEYDLRPSYWVEPHEGFDKGRVELVELPASAESSDNVFAQWLSDARLDAKEEANFSYRLSTREPVQIDPSLARVVHTLIAQPGDNMLGAPAGSKRYLVDFAGAALQPFLAHPSDLTVVASASGGTTTTSVQAHIDSPTLRVILDAVAPSTPDAVATLQLMWRGRPISESWVFPLG